MDEAASPSGPTPVAEASERRGGPRWPWLVAALAPLVTGPVWISISARFLPGFAGATFSGAILLSTLAVCTVTDLQRRKIPNWATYTAFLWALGIDLHASLTGSVSSTSGAIGILAMLEGSALCFAITLVAFFFSGGGAGDVKLAAVIGAFLGGRAGLMSLAWSYVFAGLGILLWIVAHFGPVFLARLAAQKAGSLLFPAHVVAPVMPGTGFLKRKVPLAPSFACGTLCYLMQLSKW